MENLKYFKLAVKIAVPIAFFVIAATEGVTSFWLAGVMAVFVLAWYGFEYFEKKV